MIIGSTISHYKIVEKLGQGGMGVVYKAEDTQLRRTVALKFLPRETLDEEDLKARLLREAQAAAGLDHPNICQVFGIHEEDGETFIAMAYIDGPSLAEKIKERPLPLDEALGVSVQIAEALHEAHEQGVVHRDIKPQNILLTAKGQVKILDFGLAALTGRSKLTKTGTTLGTPAYMSPEQLEGRDVDRRTDVWALGCVLYEMLTQKTPFDAEYEQAIGYGILNEEPEPVTALRSGLPTETDRVVLRALAKRSEERYQHVDDMLVDLQALRKLPAEGETRISAASADKSNPNRSFLKGTAVGIALLVTGLGFGWWLHDSSGTSRDSTTQYRWTRLTSDAGLTYDPAISPDGTLLAYASDRAGSGDLDIWLKTVAGGQPSRRTQHEADDSDPAFSPDGSKIAFRSTRDGGGIYVMPTIAGEPQLVAMEGRRPQFSPDGNWIAYWVGEPLATNATIHVVSASGGQARQLATDFFNASSPVWSPDGSRILFAGQREVGSGNDEWWIVSREGGEPAPVGFDDVWRSKVGTQYNTGERALPTAWSAEEDSVIFAAGPRDSADLWSVTVSSLTGRVEGSLSRLTAGASLDTQPSLAVGGRLVYASLSSNIDVWSLPLDGNTGRPTGEIQRVTQDTADNIHPNLSADGKTLVFLSDRTGNRDVWTSNLETGEQSALTDTPEHESYPLVSSDGSMVVYRADAIYRRPSAGGMTEQVCDDCGDPFHLSRDNSKILHRFAFAPSSIGVFDLLTGENKPVLEHSEYHIFGFQVSPDGRWVTFHLGSPGNTQIFVVPLEEPVPQDEKDWIAVTPRDAVQSHPRWSPDGNLVYYQSERDGSYCIWAQRLDPESKAPIGDPFAVYHSHSARRSIGNVGAAPHVWVSVARDKMVFSMRELTGNIWMMQPMEDAP